MHLFSPGFLEHLSKPEALLIRLVKLRSHLVELSDVLLCRRHLLLDGGGKRGPKEAKKRARTHATRGELALKTFQRFGRIEYVAAPCAEPG
eukprot:9490634-Pyramimonas_sp.AAC.2